MLKRAVLPFFGVLLALVGCSSSRAVNLSIRADAGAIDADDTGVEGTTFDLGGAGSAVDTGVANTAFDSGRAGSAVDTGVANTAFDSGGAGGAVDTLAAMTSVDAGESDVATDTSGENAFVDAGESDVTGPGGTSATCSGCTIDNVCVVDGALNPGNSCQRCDVKQSKAFWTNYNGASCDDGLFCTVGETCQEGACTASGVGACPSGQICLEGKKQCCIPGTEDKTTRLCDVNGNVARTDTCGQIMPVEKCVSSDNHGTCSNGFCGCKEGYGGNDCKTCIVYADASRADDTYDGASWGTAKKTLQAALEVAITATNKCQVWVKAGTYKPTTDSGDRQASFILKTGVFVYGGFVGGEVALVERDWANNVTILSGDIDGNDTIDDNNSYHVVTGASDAVLDGFTITMGNAIISSDTPGFGGGMLNSSCSSLTVANCTFSENAASDGAGMYNESSSPTVTNCTFSDNHGSGMYNNASSAPVVTNCTFLFNLGRELGGGMFNYSSSPTVTGCMFQGNSATQGGGMYNNASSPTVTNCVFSNNLAYPGMGGGMYNNASSSPVATNCTFSENAAHGLESENAGGGMYNASSLPIVMSSIMRGTIGIDQISGDASVAYDVTYSDVQLADASKLYFGTGNINSDPLFLSPDPTDPNYLRLSSTSPCIGTAVGGRDMGAYPYSK
jgi:parallel beta-helix repeat protein